MLDLQFCNLFWSILSLCAGSIDNADNTGTFDWAPTMGQAGSYDVAFTATDTAGLIDTEVVTITVRIPGDLDRDGDADEADLSIFSTTFGWGGGSPSYNPEADFDQDEDVDGTDLSVFSGNFSRNWNKDRHKGRAYIGDIGILVYKEIL